MLNFKTSFGKWLKTGVMLTAIFMFGNFAVQASAANVISGQLQIAYDGDAPWFAIGPMAPGDMGSKSFDATNLDDQDHLLRIMVDGSNYDAALAQALRIQLNSGATTLLDTNLSALWNSAQDIVNLTPNNTKNLIMQVTFDVGSDNALQDHAIGPFNIYLGFDYAPDDFVVPVDNGSGGLMSLRRGNPLSGIGTEAVPDSVAIAPPANPPVTVQPDGDAEVVKGAETEGTANKPWWPWLIIPVASGLAGLILAKHWLRDIGVPLAGGIVAGAASIMTHGPIPAWLFWLVLAVEFIVGAGALYLAIEEAKVAATKQPVQHSKKKKKRHTGTI